MLYALLVVLLVNGILLWCAVAWIGEDSTLIYAVIYAVGMAGTAAASILQGKAPLWLTLCVGVLSAVPLLYYLRRVRHRSSKGQPGQKIRYRSFVLLISAIGTAITLLAILLAVVLDPRMRIYLVPGVAASIGIGIFTLTLLLLAWRYNRERLSQEGFHRW